MASGMLVNNAAAMRAPQWYTSPRTNAIGTPKLTVILSTELMKVRAYTNSCNTSVKLNTTTVKIAGTMRRGAGFKLHHAPLEHVIHGHSYSRPGIDLRI